MLWARFQKGVKHSAFLLYEKPERTGKMMDEFSWKRLLSIFRYCFGNVSGMFREWYPFYKPNFRLEISRNHAPGFLISKDTKKLRETSDNICRIAKICRHFFSDILYFSPKFSVFPRYSPIFSAFLRNSLHISFFSSYLCSRNSAAPQGLRCYNLYKSIKKRCSPAVRDG